MFELNRDGLTLCKSACSEAELLKIEDALAGVAPDKAGVRLSGIDQLTESLSINGCVGQIAARFLGSQVQAVRAILFDKSASINWALGWHQDRTIVVKTRVEYHGFGPWSVKAGLQHVTPPFDLLSRMLTLRVHLDTVDCNNAPLQVAIASHKRGRVAEDEISQVITDSTILVCEAKRGDVWVYVTPILHASAAAANPRRRRVLQVDYTADNLPGGLEWLGI